MPLGVGVKSIAFIGKQSAEGSPDTTADAALDIVSINVKPVRSFVTNPSIYGGVSEQDVRPLSIYYQGTMRVRGNLRGAGMALLLEAVLGSQSGAPAHLIVEAVDSSWWTLHYSRGDYDTGQYEQLSDMKFTGFTFTMAAGGGAEAYGNFDFEFVAKTHTSDVTLSGPPSLPTSDPILYTLVSAATVCDGVNAGASPLTWYPTRVSISYKAPYTADLPYFSTTNMLSPCRNGQSVCEWEWEERLIDHTLLAKLKAGTLSSPLVLPVVNGSYSMVITSSEAYAIDYNSEVSGYGPLSQTIKWRAQRNTTDSGSLKVLHTSNV